MTITGRIVVGTIAFVGWLTSAAAGGESVLQRLEQAIRSSTSHHTAAAPQHAAEPVAEQAPAQPQPHAAPSGAEEAKRPGQQPQSAGYLGAVADDSNDRGRGVRVIEVRPGSPAEKAGLKPQDLITGVAGTRVRELADMASILSLFAPGDTLTLDVRRGEQVQQIKVTLGVRPGGASQPAGQPSLPSTAAPQPAGDPAKSPTPQPPTGPVLKLPDLPQPAEPVVPPAAETKPPGQPLDMAELKSLLVELQQRIEKLEARVGKLEKALAEPQNKQ